MLLSMHTRAWPDGHESCQVAEDLCVVLVPLNVLALDEVLNALLDQLEVGLEHARQLLHNLCWARHKRGGRVRDVLLSGHNQVCRLLHCSKDLQSVATTTAKPNW